MPSSMDTRHVVDELCEVLTSKLVASLAGARDPHNVVLWASGELEPSEHEEQRLRLAHATFLNIEAGQCRRTAQPWFMSPNPRLGGSSPLKATRSDHFRAVTAAAAALMEAGYDG